MSDKITEQIEQTSNDKFLSAVESAEWAEVTEIVEKLDQIPNFWDNVMKLENIREHWKKTFVRRKIKQIKNDDGIPLFASVEVTKATGETVRVYKREDDFSSEDYQNTARYHANMTTHNARLAIHYADGFEAATGKKMRLPFDKDSFVD